MALDSGMAGWSAVPMRPCQQVVHPFGEVEEERDVPGESGALPVVGETRPVAAAQPGRRLDVGGAVAAVRRRDLRGCGLGWPPPLVCRTVVPGGSPAVRDDDPLG